MSATAHKVTQYLEVLDDRTRAMSEFELHSILTECRRMLKTVSSYEATGYLVAMGIAYTRLRRYEESYDCLRKAAALEPTNDTLKLNVGAALANLGKYTDAIEVFSAISERGREHDYLLWANTSECLAHLGLHEDACVAFEEAVRVADMTKPQVLITLAEQAAILGADDQSLELLARLVAYTTHSSIEGRPLLDIVKNAPDTLRMAIDEKPSLRAVVARAMVFDGIARPDCCARSVSDNRNVVANYEAADRATLMMLEATRPMRARANQAAFAEADDA